MLKRAKFMNFYPDFKFFLEDVEKGWYGEKARRLAGALVVSMYAKSRDGYVHGSIDVTNASLGYDLARFFSVFISASLKPPIEFTLHNIEMILSDLDEEYFVFSVPDRGVFVAKFDEISVKPLEFRDAYSEFDLLGRIFVFQEFFLKMSKTPKEEIVKKYAKKIDAIKPHYIRLIDNLSHRDVVDKDDLYKAQKMLDSLTSSGEIDKYDNFISFVLATWPLLLRGFMETIDNLLYSSDMEKESYALSVENTINLLLKDFDIFLTAVGPLAF